MWSDCGAVCGVQGQGGLRRDIQRSGAAQREDHWPHCQAGAPQVEAVEPRAGEGLAAGGPRRGRDVGQRRVRPGAAPDQGEVRGPQSARHSPLPPRPAQPEESAQPRERSQRSGVSFDLTSPLVYVIAQTQEKIWALALGSF